MDVTAELLALEKLFWDAAGGDRTTYAAHLADDAVHVFPRWRVSDRERVLGAVEDSTPWESFTIDNPRAVELGDNAAALVYTTNANRAGQAPYVAAITTVYRREDGEWRPVLHQQTPL